MPRQARLDAPGTLHHVIGRGIEGTKIFRDDFDRKDFLSRVSDLYHKGAWVVYAWAILPNHFHFLVRTKEYPLSLSMKKLLTGYVVNFNRRHRRYGHLFHNRYKSIVCEDDPYLLELTRYIHLNPLRAGLVKDLKELCQYPWSGQSAVVNEMEREWQDTDTVLNYFGKKKRSAREKYMEYVAEGVSRGRRPELVGGGLIRSLGGWSEVLSLRPRGEKTVSDERILGSSDFVMHLFSEAERKKKAMLRIPVRVPGLPVLAARISEKEKIEEADLRSGGRERTVAGARKLFCQLAVRRMRYTGAEVARFLGVTTAAANKAANSEEMTEVEEYLKLFRNERPLWRGRTARER